MRGYGDSDKPEGTGGYDARALAEEFRSLVRLLDFRRGRALTLVAHDMGAPAALLWAANHPDEVMGLMYLEEPVLLEEVISKVIAFNPQAMQRGSLWWWILPLAPGAAERLIVGNERAFLTWFYDRDPSSREAIEPPAVDEYLRSFSGREGVLGALGVYRAVFTTMEQTAPLVQARIGTPVVALGGERAQGARVRAMIEMVASDVRGGTIPDCSHFLPGRNAPRRSSPPPSRWPPEHPHPPIPIWRSIRMTEQPNTPPPPIPPDDPGRQLNLARPDDAGALPHLSVVGDTYTTLLSGDDTAGRFSLIDMHVPPGGGPPPHRHDSRRPSRAHPRAAGRRRARRPAPTSRPTTCASTKPPVRSSTSTGRSSPRSAPKNPTTVAAPGSPTSTARAASARCSSASAAPAATTSAATSRTATATDASIRATPPTRSSPPPAACAARRAPRPSAAPRPTTGAPPATTTAPAPTSSPTPTRSSPAPRPTASKAARPPRRTPPTRSSTPKPAAAPKPPTTSAPKASPAASRSRPTRTSPASRSRKPRSTSSPRWPVLAQRTIIVTTGTRHSILTVNGGRSDHADGYAADIGMAANGGTDDSPTGDRIMAACLIAGGMPRPQAIATARRGGLYTLENDGLRIQCIWKTDAGGNHHNHVHAGARPNS